MHKSRLKLIPLTIALILTGCGPTTTSGNKSETSTSTSKLPEVTNSVKCHLIYLMAAHNYTLSVYSSQRTSYDLVFSEDAVGTRSNKKNELNLLIEDENGIYHLNYDNRYIAGDLIVDDAKNPLTNLWSTTLFESMRDIDDNYVRSLDETKTKVEIINKATKIKILTMIGRSTSDYLKLRTMIAEVSSEGVLSLSLNFENTISPIEIVAKNYNTTVVSEKEEFLASGGGPLNLSKEFNTVKRLFKEDNFTRNVWDTGEQKYNAYELFNPYYYYFETYGANSGTGYVALNSEDKAYKGSYYFQVDGSIASQEGLNQNNLGIITKLPAFVETDMPYIYHYPKYAALWDNLHFLNEGLPTEVRYQADGNTYHTVDSKLIRDFANNFSIFNAFPEASFVPFALGLDIELADEDKDSVVTFLYYFTNAGTDYIMPFRFFNFGASNIHILDNVLAVYNIDYIASQNK